MEVTKRCFIHLFVTSIFKNIYVTTITTLNIIVLQVVVHMHDRCKNILKTGLKICIHFWNAT